MYTKQNFINSVTNEVRIINHLYSTINSESMYEYRPSENQRSLIDLLWYMSGLVGKQIRIVLTGDTKDAGQRAISREEFKIESFPKMLNQSLSEGVEHLKNVTDDDLKEIVSLYGMPEDEKGAYLVDFVLKQLTAYRMQLFLYIKASGREDIGTMDVWGGRSAQ